MLQQCNDGLYSASTLTAISAATILATLRRKRVSWANASPFRPENVAARNGLVARARAGPEGGLEGWTVERGLYLWRFFYFFIFVFYKNIFSIWKFTGIYPGRPAAGRPGSGRPGLLCKNFCSNNCAQVPGGRSPGCWATGSPTLI